MEPLETVESNQQAQTSEAPAAANTAPPAKPRRGEGAWETLRSLLMVLAGVLCIRTFIAEATVIPTGSMEKTIMVGDHVFLNKLLYGPQLPYTSWRVPPLRTIHHGDIIAFRYPVNPSVMYVKRVIAVGGDMVEVRDKSVYVDGRKIDDPHAYYQAGSEGQLTMSPRDRYGPATVPKGKVFVMGDNRDRSYDSRFWGFVDDNEVEGRAMVIYWSWDSDSNSTLPIRWTRFGRIIH